MRLLNVINISKFVIARFFCKPLTLAMELFPRIHKGIVTIEQLGQRLCVFVLASTDILT